MFCRFPIDCVMLLSEAAAGKVGAKRQRKVGRKAREWEENKNLDDLGGDPMAIQWRRHHDANESGSWSGARHRRRLHLGKELSFFQTKPCGEIYSLEMGFAVLSEAFFFLESGICKMFGEMKKSQKGRRRRIGRDANEHLEEEEEEEEVHMTVDPKAEA